MSSEQDDRIKQLFILEAEEHLVTLENGLVDLKSTMSDSETINDMFRAAHSVKGGAAMLGMHSVQKVAHRLEDCFKIIRENPVDIDQTVESQFLKGYDTLKELVERLQGPYGLREEEGQEIVDNALPLFSELETNLNTLVGGGTVSQSTAVGNGKTLSKSKFAQQVKSKLKEMLEVFKQADSPDSRKQLTEVCNGLLKLDENTEIWKTLVTYSRQAIASSKLSYQILAPVIIKELNQAGELIQAGKVQEIVASQDLKEIAKASEQKKVTLPKDPKEVVKLIIKSFNHKQLEAIARLLVKHVKSSKNN
ncbi:Hpt domain-containing protein [Okeania sp. SIO1I7]|uniref:Hpt domain-containing protein n=1 Tax=Okeania sp. SIO1I7 TaxID=2607772 RepID=UPI0013F83531|nr:Hpt domain-containing protein [Okeania sp. SIO1I7]NET29483.1 histidine kinase [Okeania sp. SIO1I7]